ncbi:hypothetical protein NKJ59_24305 [Mesorhizobium australicum]|uniref:hypothetical protein n=1 Tax=Mesorhizobium australicum TaxID=536018 RepID=UPI003339A64A
MLNILLSGTGIVRFGCLIRVCRAVHISNDGESGLNLAANDIVPVRLVNGPPASEDTLTRLERLKNLLDEKVTDRDQFERLRQQIV